MSGKYFDYPEPGLFKNNFNIKVIFLISDVLSYQVATARAHVRGHCPLIESKHTWFFQGSTVCQYLTLKTTGVKNLIRFFLNV